MTLESEGIMQPVPSRNAGLARLQAFLPNAGRHYAATRNSDFGPGDRSNVSVLSPYIRHRLILETEVLDAVLGRFAISTAEKFVQEVFWRTYFKGWLEQRPGVWTAYRADVAALADTLARGGGLSKAYREAVEGRTGIDCFDAWARELVETGYLHNHARMWFASIWIFTLRLPWQLGADFFYRNLMDGDPASNTLSWRWVGGLHTKGKTYLARPDNIATYTAGRFSAHGQLAGDAPPLVEERQHARKPIPVAADRMPYGKAVLLLTEEDGHPESLFAGADVAAVLALAPCEARSPWPAGAAARGFAEGAMADVAARVGAMFDHHVQSCPAHGLVQSIIAATRSSGVSTVATAYAPVGPVAETLAAATPELAEAGVRLVQIRRGYDDLAWPHATKGFFALKTKIPDVLEDLAREVQPRLL